MSEEHASKLSYPVVFGLLVAAFVLSLIIGAITTSPPAIAAIFALSGVKAYLVLFYFLHLRAEPRFIKVLVASLVLLLFCLYIGLMTDIVWVYGQ